MSKQLDLWDHEAEVKLEAIENKLAEITIAANKDAMRNAKSFYKLGYAKAVSDVRNEILKIKKEG